MDNDNGINDELEDLDLDSPLDSGQQYNDLMSDIVDIPVVMADTDQGRDAQNRGRAIAVGTEIEASTSDEEIDERNIVDPRLVSGVKPTTDFSMPIPTRHQLPKDMKQVEQDVLNDSGRGESQADINNNTFRNDVSMSQSLMPDKLGFVSSAPMSSTPNNNFALARMNSRQNASSRNPGGHSDAGPAWPKTGQEEADYFSYKRFKDVPDNQKPAGYVLYYPNYTFKDARDAFTYEFRKELEGLSDDFIGVSMKNR